MSPEVMANVSRGAPTAHAYKFVLPLGCAPLTNQLMRMFWAKRQRLKLETYTRMCAQHGRRSKPLPGKPVVEVVRYSRSRPDADGLVGGVKLILDVLKSGKQGLGYLVDDDPSSVELRVRWAKAQTRDGRVVVTVAASP